MVKFQCFLSVFQLVRLCSGSGSNDSIFGELPDIEIDPIAGSLFGSNIQTLWDLKDLILPEPTHEEENICLPAYSTFSNGQRDSKVTYYPEKWGEYATSLQNLALYPPSLPESTGRVRQQKPPAGNFNPSGSASKKVKETQVPPRRIVGPAKNPQKAATKKDLDPVLNSCLPDSYFSKLAEVVVVEEKIIGTELEMTFPLSTAWLENVHAVQNGEKGIYTLRKFKPADYLGISSLIAGPQHCIKEVRNHLSFRHSQYGIKVERNSFQVIPELRAWSKQQKPLKKPDGQKAAPRRTLNGRGEEHIKALLTKEDNKGGIIGKFSDGHLKIYFSSIKAFYRAFIYNGDSIIDLQSGSDTIVHEGNNLFIVPDGVTGQAIKNCLKERLHDLILKCIIKKFRNVTGLRGGDFVMATIGSGRSVEDPLGPLGWATS